MSISDESVFPLNSSSLIPGRIKQLNNIWSPPSIPRNKFANRKTISSTSRRVRNVDPPELRLRARKLGDYGPRLIQFYGGSTLEARYRTLRRLEGYWKHHNQLPIMPIGSQGPRGGTSQLQWICRICGDDFTTFQKAAVHLTSGEWGLANWHCEDGLCDRVYQSRNELIRHANAAHLHTRSDGCKAVDTGISPVATVSAPTPHPNGTAHSPKTHPGQVPMHLVGENPGIRYLNSPNPSLSLIAPRTADTWGCDHPAGPSPAMQHPPYNHFERLSSFHADEYQFHPLQSCHKVEIPVISSEMRAMAEVRGLGNDKRMPTRYGTSGASHVPSIRMEAPGSFPGALNPVPLEPYNGSYLLPATHLIPRDYIEGHSVPQLYPECTNYHAFPASTISISHSTTPPRNPTTDVHRTQYFGSMKPIQTPDQDNYAVDRGLTSNHRSDTHHVEWLNYNSDFKQLTLYRPADGTSGQASNPIRVSNKVRANDSPPIRNDYILEKPYSYQMVRLWPRLCSLRPIGYGGWEGGLMPAREACTSNLLIGHDSLEILTHRSIYFTILTRVGMPRHDNNMYKYAGNENGLHPDLRKSLLRWERDTYDGPSMASLRSALVICDHLLFKSG